MRSPENITSASGTQATMSPEVCPAPSCIKPHLALAEIDRHLAFEGQRRPGQAGNALGILEQARKAAIFESQSCWPRSSISRWVSADATMPCAL